MEGFERYFTYLKINIKGNIELFVSDRSYCQNKAYRNVFPGCDYIFCKRHISENISNNMGISIIIIGIGLPIISLDNEVRIIRKHFNRDATKRI